MMRVVFSVASAIGLGKERRQLRNGRQLHSEIQVTEDRLRSPVRVVQTRIPGDDHQRIVDGIECGLKVVELGDFLEADVEVPEAAVFGAIKIDVRDARLVVHAVDAEGQLPALRLEGGGDAVGIGEPHDLEQSASDDLARSDEHPLEEAVARLDHLTGVGIHDGGWLRRGAQHRVKQSLHLREHLARDLEPAVHANQKHGEWT